MTNLPVLDALSQKDWAKIFPSGSLDRVLAEHVIEHWYEQELRLFLGLVRPFLSPLGRLRLAVPDGFHPSPSYIDYVKPGGYGCGSDDHKVLYNCHTITRILEEEGYDYTLLEYFDEQGQFHISAWQVSDGFVERSAHHDSRNRDHPLSYTSLIVDTWPRKP